MILADTSVWGDHLRHGDAQLASLLETGQVLIHPFVVGELALGELSPRVEILAMLQNLPAAEIATDHEVLDFIQNNLLARKGIGYVDAHLLTATRLTADALFLTRDRRLSAVAQQLGLAATF